MNSCHDLENGYGAILLVAIGVITVVAGVAGILQGATILKFNDDIVVALATVIIRVCIIAAAAIRRKQNGQVPERVKTVPYPFSFNL